MKRIAFWISVLIALWHSGQSVMAQESGSQLYLMQQFQRLGSPRLNEVLRNNGLSELPLAFGSGMGGYGFSKNLVIGGEGNYFQGSRTNARSTTEANGGWGFFYAGYRITKSKWALQPVGGVGGGGYTVTIVTRDNPINVGELGDGKIIRVSNGNFMVHTGLHAEYAFSNRNTIGVKTGYNFSLSRRAWSSDFMDTNVRDAFAGGYLHINFGFKLH